MAEIHLTGRAASPGLAIGPVTVLTAAVARRTVIGDPAQEAAALKAAIEGATAELVKLIGSLEGEVADILEFQAAMLEDDRAVGIADLGITSMKRHPIEWRLSCSRKPALQAHHRTPVPNFPLFVRSWGALSDTEHTDMGTR